MTHTHTHTIKDECLNTGEQKQAERQLCVCINM